MFISKHLGGPFIQRWEADAPVWLLSGDATVSQFETKQTRVPL